MSLFKWPCAISSRYVTLSRTGCHFLAACTNGRKQFWSFSPLSFWTGVYSSRKRLRTGRRKDRQVRVHYDLRPEISLVPLRVDGNRSISKISDSLPGSQREERIAAFPFSCLANLTQSSGILQKKMKCRLNVFPSVNSIVMVCTFSVIIPCSMGHFPLASLAKNVIIEDFQK